MGSSPRMRGSPDVLLAQFQCVGIIPAHAGLTSFLSFASSRAWDHPRACGAHRSSQARRVAAAGSSPRMRGSLADAVLRVDELGIIPAHAGLTKRTWKDWLDGRDHPRACGAHAGVRAVHRVVWGSSPRMRGSLLLIPPYREEHGIIPAHAGLTKVLHSFRPELWDHPRACGAHFLPALLIYLTQGSSPRMRGSPCRQMPTSCLHGIIPAHAGLTRRSS